MTESKDPTADLIARLREVQRLADPDVDIEIARQCVIDWSAVLLAAFDSPEYRAVTESDRSVGGVQGSACTTGTTEAGRPAGLALEFGHGRLVAASQAAGANARHAHLLDFDDVHLAVPGHTGAPVVAAAWAAAEGADRSVEHLLQGVLVGVEAMAWLGRATEPHHHARGWHPTATLGSVGAAVAAAATLGADDDRLRSVIGLAVLQSAGLKKAFGTWGKAWQVGCAARNGVDAAFAALDGLTCEPDMIGGPDGFIATYGQSIDGYDPVGSEARARSASTTGPLRPAIRDVIFKLHAACFSTHSSIQAAEELRGLLGRDVSGDASQVVAQIRDFEVRVGPRFASVVDHPRPSTALEAKFSATGTVAMTLLGLPTVDPTTFSTDLVCSPDYVALENRGVMIPDETVADNAAVVVVHTATGSTLSAAVDAPGAVPTTAASLAEQRARVDAKFLGLNAAPAARAHADHYLSLVHGPPSRTVRALAEAIGHIRRAADQRG